MVEKIGNDVLALQRGISVRTCGQLPRNLAPGGGALPAGRPRHDQRHALGKYAADTFIVGVLCGLPRRETIAQYSFDNRPIRNVATILAIGPPPLAGGGER